MVRSTAFLFSFVLIAVPAGAQPAQPAQEHIHWQEFKNKIRWKDSLIKTMIGASWAEARNSPHEWNRTWAGFGKRAASSYGQRLIKGATELGVSSTLTHEDLRYHKSNQEGAWPRLKFALVRTLWVAPVPDLDAVPDRLAALPVRAHAVALAAPERRRAALAPALAATGATRITTFGKLQAPPLDWAADGTSAFRRHLRWTRLEG